jgi:hypothetical protein
MPSVTQSEFGYYPFAMELHAGPVAITTLPGLKEKVAEVSGFDTVDNDWLFILPERVRCSEGAGNRMFTLPKTHSITHSSAMGEDHVAFHIWALSFFTGMRLTTTNAGFADATPIRPYKLVDFGIGGKFGKAVELAEAFWSRRAPSSAKLAEAAIHALFLGQNPRLFQFEEFIYLYTALDACFALAQSLKPKEERKNHSDRIGWMCKEFGMTTPPWAEKLPGTRAEVAAIRNPTFHEALFMGEPLGFALHGIGTNQNLSLEMTALICRLLVVLLGASSTDYVRSPINTRSLHSLDL